MLMSLHSEHIERSEKAKYVFFNPIYIFVQVRIRMKFFYTLKHVMFDFKLYIIYSQFFTRIPLLVSKF